MTAFVPTPSLVGGLGLLERAMGYTLGSLQLVTSRDLGRRTPCADWDLRELLLHMTDSLDALHEAADTGHVGMLAAGSPAAGAGDLVEGLRDRACQLLGAWTSTADTDVEISDLALTAGLVASTGALEVCVHGWDVAAACLVDRPIPATLARDLLDVAFVVVTDTDRPHRFARPRPVSADASASTRLLAWLGRDVRHPLR